MGCIPVSEQHTAASEQTDKTSSVTRQDANYSLVHASSSSPGFSPPIPRIKFPSSIGKTAWNELDRALGQGLRRLMKKESSMKMFTDCIYNICLEKFGQISTKRPEEATKYQSRKQREIQKLRQEKKILRRRWREASDDQREGLSVLWREVKERAADLRCAERLRQKKYQRCRARASKIHTSTAGRFSTHQSQEFSEGKIFFATIAQRLTRYMVANQYVNASVQKGGAPGVPGCIEHTTIIWEAFQRAKRNRLSLHVVWLDLANA